MLPLFRPFTKLGDFRRDDLPNVDLRFFVYPPHPPRSPRIPPKLRFINNVTRFARGATRYSRCISSVNRFTRWRQSGRGSNAPTGLFCYNSHQTALDRLGGAPMACEFHFGESLFPRVLLPHNCYMIV